MNTVRRGTWGWIWPSVGATPVHQGLDSEMFDRTDYQYSETFVREAIQNSLDARLDLAKPVLVSFSFRSESSEPRRVFLNQVMEHRRKAGLAVPDEWSKGIVRWLAVEDFNTKGLGGSLTSRTGDFWNYWLNFGLSNKGGSDRGGRGIGRVTFLIASRVQSVVGYTRRSGDGLTAVCGMAVLKAQEDGDDLKSTHAYFAASESGNIYTLHRSADFHDGIRDAFAFTGYGEEHKSGLALAILYPHAELTADSILAAAIENFAPAIINGSVSLRVDGRVLDAASIDRIAVEVAENLNDDAIKSSVSRYLRLVREGLDKTSAHTIRLPSALKGDLDAVRGKPETKTLLKKIASDEDVCLNIVFPLKKNGTSTDVSVQAVLGPTTQGCRPLDRLFRRGMSLPDVRAKNPGELDMVMLVGDGLLSTYLNLCEGKAHLDLLESKEVSQKIEDNGFDGVRVKRLIKQLPSELRLLLTPDSAAPDAHVFDSYFSKPSDQPGKKKKPTKPNDPPDPPPPPKPVMFKIETLSDGLRIKANPEHTDWPLNVTVALAYADGTRSPSWSPFDFEFSDLNVTATGCDLSTEKNRLRAMNCSQDAEIVLTGFDRNRELDASIRPWKNA